MDPHNRPSKIGDWYWTDDPQLYIYLESTRARCFGRITSVKLGEDNLIAFRSSQLTPAEDDFKLAIDNLLFAKLPTYVGNIFNTTEVLAAVQGLIGKNQRAGSTLDTKSSSSSSSSSTSSASKSKKAKKEKKPKSKRSAKKERGPESERSAKKSKREKKEKAKKSHTQQDPTVSLQVKSTHECSKCLCTTVQGEPNPPPPNVAIRSTCSAEGGGPHLWVRIVSPAEVKMVVEDPGADAFSRKQ